MVFIGMVLMGMLFILLKTVNMLLGKEIGVYKSNISNHLTGAITGIIILLFLGRGFDFSTIQISKFGVYPLLGGIVGAFFVVLSNYTMSKVKVVISTVLILLGQSIAAIIIDYIYSGSIISMTQLIGSVLILIAIFLYNYEKKSEPVSDDNLLEEIWTK